MSGSGVDPAAPSAAGRLPRGRVPTIGIPELVGALQHRWDRRRQMAQTLQSTIDRLAAAVERQNYRIAELQAALDRRDGPR